MERLKGAEIKIGRDPQRSTLLALLFLNGQQRKIEIPEAGIVPNSVSRCMPPKKTHCTICIDDQKRIYVENDNPENITKVNGTEVSRKKISENSAVSLGAQNFPLPLQTLLDKAKKLAGPEPPKTFSLAGLQTIWDQYENEIENLGKKQRSLTLLRNSATIFTIGSGGVSGVMAFIGLSDWAWVSGVVFAIGLFLLIYSSIMMSRLNVSQLKSQITKSTKAKYLCPNPDCGKILLLRCPQDMIAAGGFCVHCKCKYTLD